MATSQTVFPHLFYLDARKALDWYKQHLGAEITQVHEDPRNRKIMHAQLKLGSNTIMLADVMNEDRKVKAPEEVGTTTVSLYVYTPALADVDRIFDSAVKGGATPYMKPDNMFWGDRWCYFADPFGHAWQIAHPVEQVSNDELQKRAKEQFTK